MKTEWSIKFYSEKVQKDIYGLPSALAAKFLYFADRMKGNGPNLGMPHTKSMDKNLFELRLKGKEGIARAFYCVVINKKIIFLHSFVKKSQKTPRNELEVARKRLKEVI